MLEGSARVSRISAQGLEGSDRLEAEDPVRRTMLEQEQASSANPLKRSL